MKSKTFFIFIVIILLLIIGWLAWSNGSFMNKIKPAFNKITAEITPDIADQNANPNSPAKNPPADKSVCGDNVCADEESKICCQDCGCEAGNYCADSGKCEVNIAFKPVPNLPDFKIKTDLSAINLSNFKPNFSKIIGLNLNNSQPVEEQAQTSEDEGLVISPHESAVETPHIYGNKIVFSQYVNTKPKGYIYDISSGELEEIPYDHDIHSPDIGLSGLVWYDYSRGTSEGSDIYYFNPENNQQGFISPRDRYQTSPQISGRSLGWQEDNQDLYLYWLPSGEEVKVFSPRGQKFYSAFAVNNGRMAFSMFENKDEGTFYKVYLYDLSKHKFSIIAETGESYVEYVAIDNNNIAYIANNKVFVYNLETKLTKKIKDNPAEKYNVAIYGDNVVWSEQNNDNKDLFYYKLSTNKTKQLTQDEGDDNFPDIYGNMLVYKNGDRQVKLMQIE